MQIPFWLERTQHDWVVEGQSASLADLPDWGSTGLGVYRIGGSTGLGSTGLGRANPWGAGGGLVGGEGTFQNTHRFSNRGHGRRNRHHRQRRNRRHR